MSLALVATALGVAGAILGALGWLVRLAYRLGTAVAEMRRDIAECKRDVAALRADLMTRRGQLRVMRAPADD